MKCTQRGNLGGFSIHPYQTNNFLEGRSHTPAVTKKALLCHTRNKATITNPFIHVRKTMSCLLAFALSEETLNLLTCTNIRPSCATLNVPYNNIPLKTWCPLTNNSSRAGFQQPIHFFCLKQNFFLLCLNSSPCAAFSPAVTPYCAVGGYSCACALDAALSSTLPPRGEKAEVTKFHFIPF